MQGQCPPFAINNTNDHTVKALGSFLPVPIDAVDSIADLASKTVTASSVIVRGYRTVGDGGEGILFRVYNDTAAVDSCAVFQDGSGNSFHRIGSAFTLKQCGAYGDGSHDDLSSAKAWFSRCLKGLDCPMGGGNFRLSGNWLWNLAAREGGVNIYGIGEGATELSFDSGFGISVIDSKPNGFFYVNMGTFGVQGSIAGPVLRFGLDNLTDGLNASLIINITVNNNNASSAAIGTLFNSVYQAHVANMTSNNACPSGANGCFGYGDAIKLAQTKFSTFTAISGGHATNSIHMSVGYNDTNVFTAPDCEEVTNCLVIDSPYTQGNTFVVFQMVYGQIYGFGVGSPNVGYPIIATAGYANKLINPNFNQQHLPTDPANLVGILVDKDNFGVSTPAVPAYGTAWTNTTTLKVVVNLWGGAVSQVCAGPAGDRCMTVTGGTFDLKPLDKIKITYTTTPSWLIQPQ